MNTIPCSQSERSASQLPNNKSSDLINRIRYERRDRWLK